MAQQRQQAGPSPAVPSAPYQPPPSSSTPGATATTVVAVTGGGLYPSLEDYMGLELSRYAPVSVTITYCKFVVSVADSICVDVSGM